MALLQSVLFRGALHVGYMEEATNSTLLVGCAQILKPIQLARFAVQSFPFLPDMLAMIMVLAEDAGEPSTPELMAAGILPAAALGAEELHTEYTMYMQDAE